VSVCSSRAQRRHSLVVRIPRCGRGDLGSTPSGVIFILFFVMRAWSDAPWSQLRPRAVSHRSVKCGGVGGLTASIDACQKLFGFQLFWFCPQKTFPFTATSQDVPLLARATPGRHAVQQRGRARVRGRTGAITRERPDSRAFHATDAPTVVNPDENLTLRSAPPTRVVSPTCPNASQPRIP
jgi:hypothetical protein